MTKKRYNFTLNEEETGIVRDWLERNGQSFSGWLTTMIDEFAHEIQAGPSTRKAPMEMTVKEFLDEIQYWTKKASEA